MENIPNNILYLLKLLSLLIGFSIFRCPSIIIVYLSLKMVIKPNIKNNIPSTNNTTPLLNNFQIYYPFIFKHYIVANIFAIS